MRQYEYQFPNGEVIKIQAIPRDGYRLITTMPKMPDPPEPSMWSFMDNGRYISDVEWDDPVFLQLEKAYDRYASNEAGLTQYTAARWVIHNGVVDGPKAEWSILPERLMYDPKMEWIFNKCRHNEIYYDLIDAIIGINMPTESGVRNVMETFQSMIKDNDEILPLLDWKSRKKRKGGMMMNLYAESLLACKELSGTITLKDFFRLPGDPRYVTEDMDIPLSMSHIIALVRHSNMSSNAVQEIEMEKDDKKDTKPDGTEFDPYWDVE